MDFNKNINKNAFLFKKKKYLLNKSNKIKEIYKKIICNFKNLFKKKNKI